MSLSAGDKLGPYEILALVGKGGMGEVYRARDPRLNRDVAIKISNTQFTERFTREARAIAALNHTNICHLYDVGADYLVMEYVEGQDLRGPMRFDDALPIIQQLIEGIQAAHEKNIVHRDLKPANIKITPEGVVKILDFGLAKAMEPPSSDGDPENSPTLTIGATKAGTILGTAAYMAPEQAKGKSADKRSDIWSFGVILYEMLTGKRLFQGESAVEILSGVLNKEPDISSAPMRVHRLLRWCLEKDRKKRLQAIGDALRQLEESELATRASAAPAWFGKVGWIVAGMLAAGLIGISWFADRARRPAELKPLARLNVDLGPDVSLASKGADAIISPDGTRLAYVSQGRLFTRRFDESSAAELAGTEGASSPFFSPDGRWVAFYTPGKLKKVFVEGGAPIFLCDASSGNGGSWGEDGNILASLNNNAALSRISSAGGVPVQATDLASGEYSHRWPQILPGGKAVLFTSNTAGNFDAAKIDVMSLRDRRRKTLVRGGTYGRYLPSGHLIYINRGTLFAVPLDLDRLETRGNASPVLREVAYAIGDGSAQLDFSSSGTMIYRSGGAAGGGLVTAQWLDDAGKTQPLLAKPDYYLFPHLSPDGQRLAFSAGDIWVYEMRRGTMTRLTFNGDNADPVWSPDGLHIVFRRLGEGIFSINSDGSGKPQLLTQSKDLIAPWSLPINGKRLAFQEPALATGYDLWTIPLGTSDGGLRAGKPEIFLQTQFNERQPFFSPDGRWLAYASDESGVYQVYVRAFPDNGTPKQISIAGGLYPVFSRNGREIFFRTEDNQIMVAGYTGKGATFDAEKPRVWSEKRLADIGVNGTNYDVAPDGRIVALMPMETPDGQKAQNHVIFLENFFDELRRRVPTNR